MSDFPGAATITATIEASAGPAICAYVTAGFPTRAEFPDVLRSVAAAADLIEVGVPFSDPMADGSTIQRASRVALEGGVSLAWIIDLLEAENKGLGAPHVFMGYYNPFIAFGLDQLGAALARSGTSGLIVPDLPAEESGPIRKVLEPGSLALIQMVAPTTPPERLRRLAVASEGFVYAVTTTGVTGRRVDLDRADLEYLERVRVAANLPVLAGFGIRTADHVAAVAPYADGVVVGTALIEVIERGDDPGEFLRDLREGAT